MTLQKHLILLSLCMLLPTTVSAATISLRAAPSSVGVGDTVQVSILLDSATPTNAFSGTLVYPSTALEPVAISDGNSLVSMWITRPTATSIPITFAGITPGGFSGNGGVLFSVLFRAKVVGTTAISLRDIEVLRNDGAGGNEPTITQPLTLAIGSKPSGGYIELADQTPPESFTTLLGTDPQLFNGSKYLVFATLDKGSGVDHYVAAESRLPSFLFPLFPLQWRTVTSPYVFVDQHLTSTIYIQAVDRAGNEQLSVFPREHFFAIYETILLGILVGVVFLWRSGWGRRLKSNL